MPERIVKKIPAKPERIRIYKIGIYCRVSSAKQEQLYSMASQVSELTKIVMSAPNWYLKDIYLDFKSGGDSDRRELNRLLSDCHSGEIDIIFTKSVGRMGRNTLDLLNIIRDLRSIGVCIIFQNEDLDSSKYENEFLITLLEAYAQAESTSRSEDIRWGLDKRMKDGSSGLYRRKCFGYTKTLDGELVICSEEAKTVRLIFNLYLKGNSILSIIKILESKGIPTPTGKEKWSNQAVVKILTNEKYTGNVILQKTISEPFPSKKRQKNNGIEGRYMVENVHPKIISQKMFEAVQKERKRRSNIIIDESGQPKRASKRYCTPKELTTQNSEDNE